MPSIQICACCGEVLREATEKSSVQTTQNVPRQTWRKEDYIGPQKCYRAILCHACREQVEMVIQQFIGRNRKRVKETASRD